MHYILDLSVIMIFLLSVIICMKTGILKISKTIASLLLALIITVSVKDYFIGYVKTTPINNFICEKVSQTLIPEKDNNETKDTAIKNPINNILNTKKAEEKIKEGYNTAAKYTAESITSAIISALTLIIVFILSRVFVFLLYLAVGAIFKLPVLNTVNKAAGALSGIIIALIIINILCTLLPVFVPKDNSQMFNDAISNTYVMKYFYNHNIIVGLFSD